MIRSNPARRRPHSPRPRFARRRAGLQPGAGALGRELPDHRTDLVHHAGGVVSELTRTGQGQHVLRDACSLLCGLRKQPGGMDNYEDGRRFAERLLAVVPGAQAAARASKNFLARAVRFLVEEAGIRQVRCRDSGRSSQARLCGLREEPDTAMDPGLWCDVTKDPYLSCGQA